MLNTETDKNFFNIGTVIYDNGYKRHHYWQDNLVEVYDKKLKGEYDFISLEKYKEKYNVFDIHNSSIKIFNRKFKEPVHNLSLSGNKLQEIKTLPKGLLSLWLQGIPKGYKLKLQTIPKSIVSIFYRWTDYTLGSNLTKLKNLKVFGVPGNHMIFSVPIFPKSIEYVDLSDCQIGRYDDNGLDNFKLEDYPNLKYINFSGNWVKKIPSEWKVKSKVKIIYNKQKKSNNLQ
jgi:hypothetical protein